MRPKEREKETINHLLRCYPLQLEEEKGLYVQRS